MHPRIIPFPRALVPRPAPTTDWNTGLCPHCFAPGKRYEHETFGCKNEAQR